MDNRIKKLRNERNMTQIRLSIELEVSQETISAYEIGKYYPSVLNLLKMTKLFDAPVEYILGTSDIRKPALETNLINEETLLLSLYNELTTSDKRKIIDYINGLRNSNRQQKYRQQKY